MNKVDFFISYQSRDLEQAKAIRNLLRKAGYTTIIQAIDMPTEDPDGNIAKAFRESRVMLACITRNTQPAYGPGENSWQQMPGAYSSSSLSPSQPE